MLLILLDVVVVAYSHNKFPAFSAGFFPLFHFYFETSPIVLRLLALSTIMCEFRDHERRSFFLCLSSEGKKCNQQSLNVY
jgi:hypothetical protein